MSSKPIHIRQAPGLIRLRELLLETKKQVLQAAEHEKKRAQLIAERIESVSKDSTDGSN